MRPNPYQPPAFVAEPAAVRRGSERFGALLALAVVPIVVLAGVTIVRARWGLASGRVNMFGYGFAVGTHALGMYAAPQAAATSAIRGTESRLSHALGVASVVAAWSSLATLHLSTRIGVEPPQVLFSLLAAAAAPTLARALLLGHGWRRAAWASGQGLALLALAAAALGPFSPVARWIAPEPILDLGWAHLPIVATQLVPGQSGASWLSAEAALRWLGLAPAALVFVALRAIHGLGGVDLHLHDTWFDVASLHATGALLLTSLALGLRTALCEASPRGVPVDAAAAALFALALHATTWFMFDLGRRGMPRRYIEFLPELAAGHAHVTWAGSTVLVGAAALVLASFARLRRG